MDLDTSGVVIINMSEKKQNSTSRDKNVKNNPLVPKCRGLRPFAGKLECDLWHWYNTQNKKVPKRVIQMQACFIFHQAGLTEFKASDGWLKRWLKRWKMFSKECSCLSCKPDISCSCRTIKKGSEMSFPKVDCSHLSIRGSCIFKYSFHIPRIITPTSYNYFPCFERSRELSLRIENSIPHVSNKDAKRSPLSIHFGRNSQCLKSPKLKDVDHDSKYRSHSSRKVDMKNTLRAESCSLSLNLSPKKKKKHSRSLQAGELKKIHKERVLQVGKRYHPQFKEKVLSYLKSHTFKEASRKFGVHQSSISTWRKDKLQLKTSEDTSALSSMGSVSPPADLQFLSWLRRERGTALTADDICSCAHKYVLLAGGLAVVERQVPWFAQWFSRFNEKLSVEGGVQQLIIENVNERRIQYPVDFRVEVASYAAKYSQMAAVRAFNVPRKCVFEWLRSFQDTKIEDKCQSSEVQRRGTGRPLTDSEVDQLIWQWYCKSQKQEHGGRCPSSQEVRAYASSLYAMKGLSTQIRCSYGWFRRWCDRFGVKLRYSSDDELLSWALAQLDCNQALSHADLQEQARYLWQRNRPDFKASPGWAIRFCKRYPKLLQTVPSITTPLPGPLMALVSQFRSSLRELVRDRALSPGAIGAMDELPLEFSAPPVGMPRRPLLLRRPGMDSCHATIVLSCLADGTLLPTMLILKDEMELTDSNPNVIVLQQDNGIMDLKCMQKWLDFVWFRYAPSDNLLVADSFAPHCATEVVDTFSAETQSTRHLRLFPAGCSSKLQPIDVAIKQTFQQYIDKCWMRLNTRVGATWTCGQQLRVPTTKELTKWVCDAHSHVMTSRQETIRRSFLVTGLLVADNHMEDHFIENPAALPPEENHSEFHCHSWDQDK